VDGAGNLYIADTSNERIREVSPGGIITTVAGNGSYSYLGDGGPATAASFQSPYALSADPAGNLAVVDQGNNAVRLLMPSGTAPVLAIQSTHAGSFAPGQTGAAYTLTVSNGPGAGPTSGIVTVTEILPAGLTLASMAGTGWTCSAPTALTCTRADALSGGSSYPVINVTVNVSASVANQLTNQASLSGGGALAAARATDLTVIAAGSAP